MTDHDAIPFLYLDNMKYLKCVFAGIWLKYIKLFCLKKTSFSSVMFLRQYTLPYIILSTSHY